MKRIMIQENWDDSVQSDVLFVPEGFDGIPVCGAVIVQYGNRCYDEQDDKAAQEKDLPLKRDLYRKVLHPFVHREPGSDQSGHHGRYGQVTQVQDKNPEDVGVPGSVDPADG